MGGQLAGIGDPDVREPVREEQASVHAALRQVRRDLLAAAQPAVGEVRAAPRLDGAQPLDRAATRLGGRLRRLDDDVDDIVVDDHAEAVVGLEPRDGLLDGLLRDGELGPGHRAGPVEHDREVHGRSATLAGRPRRDDAARARNARCGWWRGCSGGPGGP